jgi:hypothetical protein
MLLNATCSPTADASEVTWCGFGFSVTGTSTMFPADITVVQWSNTTTFLEDRDAQAGYSAPPCFSSQLSVLLSAARDARGVLRASWLRPVLAQPPHVPNLDSVVTAIGAASFDSPPAASACAAGMQLHTLVAPGADFRFPR